jgi:hypothetical protein
MKVAFGVDPAEARQPIAGSAPASPSPAASPVAASPSPTPSPVAASPSPSPSPAAAPTIASPSPTPSPRGAQPDPNTTFIPTSGKTPSPDPETAVKQWLDQHQFAPPEKQPDKGEQHVLLQGQEVTLSAAVKTTAAETKQPADLVQRVIVAALNQPPPASIATRPLVGPGNQIPGLNPNDPGQQMAILKASEIKTVDDWLGEHSFGVPDDPDPEGVKATLDGAETTIDHVVDLVMSVLGNNEPGIKASALNRADVMAHLRQKYASARNTKDKAPGTQIQVQYQLVPKGLQAAPGAKVTQHQFTFSVVFQHGDANHVGGLDVTPAQGVVVLDNDGNIVSLQAGAQAAYVQPLLGGWIQVSGLAQVMATVNWNRSVNSKTTISGGWQAVAGGQIMVSPIIKSGAFKFLSGHVQIGPQIQAGIEQGGAPIASGGGILGFSF